METSQNIGIQRRGSRHNRITERGEFDASEKDYEFCSERNTITESFSTR